ncbi:hypothetical protein HIM_00085 [Hirsutella minnesotensis 3608]|nr:hypothetical protein HIM_00085 [Hirsutella minnesotensis 3608]
MKLSIHALGMLAGVATAVIPHHNLYFPRSNSTAEYPVPQPAGPAAPLGTGAPAYPPPAGQPQRPGQAGPANTPAYNQPAAQPPAPSAPARDQTTVITTTKSSTIHRTVTQYVRPTAAGAAGAGKKPFSTTTITSQSLTTVTVSRVSPNAGPSGVVALENNDQGNGQCAPATVTVTAPAVASTVYVTVTPQATPPTPGRGRQPPLVPRPPPAKGGRGPGSTLTVLSTATVVPYPVGGGNGTQPIGYPRPTGFARVRR